MRRRVKVCAVGRMGQGVLIRGARFLAWMAWIRDTGFCHEGVGCWDG